MQIALKDLKEEFDCIRVRHCRARIWFRRRARECPSHVYWWLIITSQVLYCDCRIARQDLRRDGAQFQQRARLLLAECSEEQRGLEGTARHHRWPVLRDIGGTRLQLEDMGRRVGFTNVPKSDVYIQVHAAKPSQQDPRTWYKKLPRRSYCCFERRIRCSHQKQIKPVEE